MQFVIITVEKQKLKFKRGAGKSKKLPATNTLLCKLVVFNSVLTFNYFIYSLKLVIDFPIPTAFVISLVVSELFPFKVIISACLRLCL